MDQLRYHQNDRARTVFLSHAQPHGSWSTPPLLAVPLGVTVNRKVFALAHNPRSSTRHKTVLRSQSKFAVPLLAFSSSLPRRVSPSGTSSGLSLPLALLFCSLLHPLFIVLFCFSGFSSTSVSSAVGACLPTRPTVTSLASRVFQALHNLRVPSAISSLCSSPS